MPNNKYKRSTRRERELVNEAREAGRIASRSAGSKGQIDVWDFDPINKVFRIIQVKTKKGGRGEYERVVKEWDGVVVRFIWKEYK